MMASARRRMAAALAVAALLAGACAGSGDDAGDVTIGPAGVEEGGGDEPGDLPVPDTAPTADGPPGDGEPGAAPSPGNPGPGAPPPTDGPGGGSTAQPALDPSGPPGSFAPDLLRIDRSQRLVVEILTQAESGPSAATVDHVTRVLREVAVKPVAVTAGSVPGSGRSWTGDDIRAAADAAGRTPQGGGVGVIRLLFLRGGFAGNDTALGVAVRGDVAALFPERITDASSPLVGRGAIEVAVVTHEVGHLLGLVDLYLDTGRADPEHPGHSPNRRSVMYWAVESSLVADVLQGGPPREFDGDDRADLDRIRTGS